MAYLKTLVFRDMTPCRCVSGSRRYERWQCHHFQGSTSPRITACIRVYFAKYIVRCTQWKVHLFACTPYGKHFTFPMQKSFYFTRPWPGPYNEANTGPNCARQYKSNRLCGGDAEASALNSGDCYFDYRSGLRLLWLKVAQVSSVGPTNIRIYRVKIVQLPSSYWLSNHLMSWCFDAWATDSIVKQTIINNHSNNNNRMFRVTSTTTHIQVNQALKQRESTTHRQTLRELQRLFYSVPGKLSMCVPADASCEYQSYSADGR
jgi:hypothetical protein